MTDPLTQFPVQNVTGRLEFPDRTLDGTELVGLVEQLAKRLRSCTEQDLLVVGGENLSGTLVAWLAGVRVGKQVLLANPELPRAFLAPFLEDRRPMLVGTAVWLADHGSAATPTLDFSDLEQGGAGPEGERPPGPWDMPGSTVFLTSGTTGGSKAVEWPWTAVHQAALNMAMVGRLHAGDMCVTSLPLFHANALLVVVLAGMLVGADVHVATKFSGSGFSELMRSVGGTKTSLLGSMATRILQTDDGSATFERIVVAPCDGRTAEGLSQRYGCSVAQIYGQTDIGICLWNDDVREQADCTGIPLPGWEARVDAADGEVGELLVRSVAPGVAARGYLTDHEMTVLTRRDFWFHTGDLFEETSGQLRYRGRTKDTVRSKGENVQAIEVETVLLHASEIGAAAVIGRSVGLGDEEIVAVLESELPVDRAVALLADEVNRRLPRYARPAAVAVVAELPRTPTQKIAKAIIEKALPELYSVDWATASVTRRTTEE